MAKLPNTNEYEDKVEYLDAFFPNLYEVLKMRLWLPKIMAVITRHPRYLPDIEWVSGSWTHNIFRAYETVFWRKYGKNGVGDTITAEMSMQSVGGSVIYACHTWEAAFALTEQYVRQFIASWKPAPFRIYIPVLQTPQGIPVFASPYLFAIALDTAVPTGDMQFNTNVTFTCTGTNRYLAVANLVQTTGSGVTGQTYNSVSMTQINSIINNGASSEDSYLYGLHAPSTGSNSIVFTTAGGTKGIIAASYTGVNQVTTPDVNTTTTGSGATATITMTTTVANCWVMAYFRTNNTFTTVGANTTSRNSPISGANWSDSNAARTQGSNSLAMNLSSANYAINGMALAPVASTDVTVSPSVLAATFSVIAATISGAANLTASVLSATFSVQSATELIDEFFTPAQPLTATFSVPAVNVITPDAQVVVSNPLSASFSAPAPVISTSTVVGASALSASFSQPSATFRGDVAPVPSVLEATFSIPAPTVIAIGNITVSPSVLASTFSIPSATVTAEQNASIAAGVLSATFTLQTPTVTAIQNVDLTATTLVATFSVQSPRRVGGLWTPQPRVNGDAEWTPQPRAI